MLKTTLELFKVNAINSLKLNDKKRKKMGPLFLGCFMIALFIAFVGYSIQAFANISVIDVAPIFYIILGLLYTYVPKKNKEKINKIEKNELN